MFKNSLELREDQAFKIKTAEQIALKAESESRTLSDEEITETDDLLASVESLKSEIGKLEYNEKQVSKIKDLSQGLKSTTTRSTTSEVSNLGGVSASKIPAQYNKTYSTLRSFGTTEQDRYEAYLSGMWIRAKFFKDDRAHRWCELNGVYHQLAQEEGTASAGGHLVPSPLLQRIIDTRDLFGTARAECDVIPMGRDSLDVPRLVSGVAASFILESASITESDQVYTQVKLTAQKLGIITRITNELAEDAVINLADFVANDMGRAFASKEDEVVFAGDGSPSDGGIVGVAQLFTSNNSFAGAIDGNDVMGDITNVDLGNLMGALPQWARPNAKWFCSSVAKDAVFNRLAITAGGHTFQTLRGELGPSFLGHEIVTNEHLPTSTGSLDNKTMFLFGDLRQAVLFGDRRGIDVASSGDRYFELDQVAIRAIERFDIALYGLDSTSTAGGIVAMIGAA